MTTALRSTGLLFALAMLACDRDAPPPDASSPMPAPPAKAASEAADPPSAAPKPDLPPPSEPEVEVVSEGVQLPQVPLVDRLPPGVRTVEVGLDAITLGGTEIATLDDGALRPADVDEHQRIPALRRALDDAPPLKVPRLALVADVNVPAATALAVLATMQPAAFGDLGLVALAGDGTRGMVPLWKVELGEPRDDPSAEAPALVVTIDAEGFRLWDMGRDYPEGTRVASTAAPGDGPWDYDALGRDGRAHAEESSTPGIGAVSPNPDVPWGVVVPSIAALRGPKCHEGKDCVRPKVVLIASGQIAYGRADVDPLGGPAELPSTASTSKIPKIRVSAPTVGPSGDKEIIRRVIRGQMSAIKACYDEGLARNPELAGRVVVRFTIRTDGSVGPATADTTTAFADADVIDCVVDLVAALTFPAPRGGGLLHIKYPFVFKPAD